MTPRSRLVFRVLAGFWLFGWFCNAPGKPGFIHNFRDALVWPLDHAAFPSPLRSAPLILAVYLAPALVLPVLVWARERLVRAASLLMVGCAFVACLHLETCNDATFVTSFWSGLWLCWFVHSRSRARAAGDSAAGDSAARDEARFYRIARGLVHLFVGMVFLGGVVGKLTGEYGSGEAFFRLYFRDNSAWPYPWLKGTLWPETFRAMATWFTSAAVACETMLAAAPILPTRVVLVVGAGTILSMMSAWTFHLASVLSSLLGLMVCAELLQRFERQTDEASEDDAEVDDATAA
jgi:hypothetical protein